MKQPGSAAKVKKVNVSILTCLTGTVGCILILAAGCTSSYEFAAPDDHPARRDADVPAYYPSQTIVESDPVVKHPAQSEHWDDDEHEHDHHDHDHDHDHHHEDDDNDNDHDHNDDDHEHQDDDDDGRDEHNEEENHQG